MDFMPLMILISIHALRVEGDNRGAGERGIFCISIHALRVEGDGCDMHSAVIAAQISIHALRVEGDVSVRLMYSV